MLQNLEGKNPPSIPRGCLHKSAPKLCPLLNTVYIGY